MGLGTRWGQVKGGKVGRERLWRGRWKIGYCRWWGVEGRASRKLVKGAKVTGGKVPKEAPAAREIRRHSLATRCTKGTEKTGDARGRWAERRVSPVEYGRLKLEVGLKAEGEVEGRAARAFISHKRHKKEGRACGAEYRRLSGMSRDARKRRRDWSLDVLKRVPDPREAESLEILAVGGGEFTHPEVQ